MQCYVEIDLVEPTLNLDMREETEGFFAHEFHQEKELPNKIRKLAVIFDQKALQCFREGMGNASEIAECHHDIENIKEGFEDDHAALKYSVNMLSEVVKQGENASAYSEGAQFIKSGINWTNIEQICIEILALAVSNQKN